MELENIISFLKSIYDKNYIDTIGTENFKIHLEFLIYINFGYRADVKELHYIQEQLINKLGG